MNIKTKGHQLIKSSNIEILMKKPKIIKIHVFLKGLLNDDSSKKY